MQWGACGSQQVRLRSHGSGSAMDPQETSPAARATPTCGGGPRLPHGAWGHTLSPLRGPGTCPHRGRGTGQCAEPAATPESPGSFSAPRGPRGKCGGAPPSPREVLTKDWI